MAKNTVQVTPFFSVRSISRALEFYTEYLGFTPFVTMDVYAYLDREGAGLRLLEHSDEDGAFAPGRCYIDVFDVGSVVSRHERAWADLPKGSTRGPVDQIYNQRELFVRDPDGNLIIFGQGIGSNARQWDGRRAD